MAPTLHVVSLPHTETTRAFEWCAYTAKTRRFATFMSTKGYRVVLYAGEHNEADCDEHVTLIKRWEQNDHFGHTIPIFDPRHHGFALFNTRAALAVTARARSDDILCLIGGTAQQPIADANSQLVCAEWGVGYGGVINTSHWCFESNAWMHTVYGARTFGDAHLADGRFYDTVIPNSYDPDEFPLGHGMGDYLLYMGRLVSRKGLAIVNEVIKATGLQLLVAGSGDTSLLPAGATYIGVIGPSERAQVMGNARALLCPTLYVEPFGGVAVEAQLCGTPVIATPFGAFTETVDHGHTGFLCHTLGEFCDAADNVCGLDRRVIRQRAVDRYSTTVAAEQYDQWFQRLQTLHGEGWYTRTAQPATA